MTKPTLSRRGFLASTAAIGAATMTTGWPTMGRAEMGKVLRVRIDGDNNTLRAKVETGLFNYFRPDHGCGID